MTKIFIIHGSYSNPAENWFPWLKTKLENLGLEVFVPKFPTPEHQSFESWMKVFEPYLHQINEKTIFVGHSLGSAFILSILEKLSLAKPIKACFFVSGFVELLGNPNFDSVNHTFVDKKFDWDKIKRNCKTFQVYHSDNDPYVDLSHGEQLAKNLGVKLFVIPNAGHFNTKAGYTKFERLLDDIKTEL
jgi:predicted alpha/beta hydrolase family esterase